MLPYPRLTVLHHFEGSDESIHGQLLPRLGRTEGVFSPLFLKVEKHLRFVPLHLLEISASFERKHVLRVEKACARQEFMNRGGVANLGRVP